MAPSPTAAATRWSSHCVRPRPRTLRARLSRAPMAATCPTQAARRGLASRHRRCGRSRAGPARRCRRQAVDGAAPMKMNSARAGMTCVIPAWSSTATASRVSVPMSSRTCDFTSTRILAVRSSWSMRYRDMRSARSPSLATSVTSAACRDRKTAAWPCEVAAAEDYHGIIPAEEGLRLGRRVVDARRLEMLQPGNVRPPVPGARRDNEELAGH